MNKVYYKLVEQVRFFKKNIRTGELKEVYVANRNGLSEKELVELLNACNLSYVYELGIKIMDHIYFKYVRQCHVFQRSKITGEVREVDVTNRNGLSEKELIRLLNLNDPDYEYEQAWKQYFID
ncbi:MAG: hypothetical protein IKH28_08665 [Lachnospiraceae bacterium]|nr:hypothetical protein [Lachnospiraceae bacterium]